MKHLAVVLVAVACAAASLSAQKEELKPAKLNFSFKDINGKKVSLSDFKGKVILLDFWATWCIPCKKEMPGFIAL